MSEFDTVLGSFGTVVDVFNILSSVATLVLGFMGFVVSKIMQGKNMREAMGSGEWPPLDGDRVEANYKQGGTWYKGKVVTSYEANYRTLYDIAYDDGDAEQGVELSDLRQVGGGGESQSQKLLASQDV